MLRLGARGTIFHGRVLDTGAGAIPGAAVRALALTADATGPVYVTTAGDDGTFALAVPAGSYLLVAAASGYASTSQPVSAAQDGPLTLRLDPAGALRGRVVASGSPVAGARVTAVGADLPWSAPRETTTGADGRFAFADLEPGAHLLAARLGALVGKGNGPVPVAVDRPPATVEIPLERGAVVAPR
jgi:hypothetical protein